MHQLTYMAAVSLFWNTNMAMTVIDFLELLPWVNGIMRLEKLQEIISLVFSFFFFHFRLIINYFCACQIIILFVMCIESEYVWIFWGYLIHTRDFWRSTDPHQTSVRQIHTTWDVLLLEHAGNSQPKTRQSCWYLTEAEDWGNRQRGCKCSPKFPGYTRSVLLQQFPEDNLHQDLRYFQRYHCRSYLLRWRQEKKMEMVQKLSKRGFLKILTFNKEYMTSFNL